MNGIKILNSPKLYSLLVLAIEYNLITTSSYSGHAKHVILPKLISGNRALVPLLKFSVPKGRRTLMPVPRARVFGERDVSRASPRDLAYWASPYT
jgi:hypothetical protein